MQCKQNFLQPLYSRPIIVHGNMSWVHKCLNMEMLYYEFKVQMFRLAPLAAFMSRGVVLLWLGSHLGPVSTSATGSSECRWQVEEQSPALEWKWQRPDRMATKRFKRLDSWEERPARYCPDASTLSFSLCLGWSVSCHDSQCWCAFAAFLTSTARQRQMGMRRY